MELSEKPLTCCRTCNINFIDFNGSPDEEYKYVIFFEDDDSKFIILKPLMSVDQNHVGKVLLDIFTLVGVPSVISTQSQDLIKPTLKLFAPLCEHFKSKIVSSDCNGRTLHIKTLIENWMALNKTKKWSNGLGYVQFYNNCKYNRETKNSPFSLFFRENYEYIKQHYTRYILHQPNTMKHDGTETLEGIVLLANNDCDTIHKRTLEIVELSDYLLNIQDNNESYENNKKSNLIHIIEDTHIHGEIYPHKRHTHHIFVENLGNRAYSEENINRDGNNTVVNKDNTYATKGNNLSNDANDHVVGEELDGMLNNYSDKIEDSSYLNTDSITQEGNLSLALSVKDDGQCDLSCYASKGENEPIGKNKTNDICIKKTSEDGECKVLDLVSDESRNLCQTGKNVLEENIDNAITTGRIAKTNSVCIVCGIKRKHINKMTLSKELNPYASGKHVHLRIPIFDRVKGHPHFLLAVIVEVLSNGAFVIGTRNGILSELYFSDRLTLCNHKEFYLDDVPKKYISMKEALCGQMKSISGKDYIKYTCSIRKTCNPYFSHHIHFAQNKHLNIR